MGEETTRFNRFMQGTTAFWHRHKPRPGSTGVLVGGLIGSSATATDIINKGIEGKPLNIWHAVQFIFFFTLASAQSWKLWHDQPPPKISGHDEEGHLR